MKKTLLFVIAALVLAAMPSYAQLPPVAEGLQNPIVVAGPAYLTSDPGAGFSRTKFFLSANVAGIKPLANVPVYIGGVGVDVRTLDPVLGSVTGVGISVPLVTYSFKGDQFVAQVGWGHDLSGDPKSSSVYVGLGFSLTSTNKLAAKRAAREAKKAGKPVPCEAP